MTGKKVQLCFAGCGGLYNYTLGIASYIQSNYNLDNVIFTGCSAGCFPSLLLASGHNIDFYFNDFNIPMLEEINKHRFGALGIWNKTVRLWTYDKLDDDICDRIKDKFYISVTNINNIWKPTNELITGWQSKADLLEGIISSSFIPFFDTKWVNIFRGHKYIDGGVTDNQPLPFGDDMESIIINYDMWRSFPKYWLWCWTDTQWAKDLFELGKQDAENNKEYFTLSKLDKLNP